MFNIPPTTTVDTLVVLALLSRPRYHSTLLLYLRLAAIPEDCACTQDLLAVTVSLSDSTVKRSIRLLRKLGVMAPKGHTLLPLSSSARNVLEDLRTGNIFTDVHAGTVCYESTGQAVDLRYGGHDG